MAKKSTRLEALHQAFKENGISSDTIEPSDSLIRNIKSYADEWGEIESFAKRKEKWLRKYLELPYGIPTDDTYRIVMGNINTAQFSSLRYNCCFMP